jgi:CheY-like chemotaxis protein
MTLLDRIKILIVEDDAIQAEMLKDKLVEMVVPSSVEVFANSDDLIAYLKTGYTSKKNFYLILDYFLQTQEKPDSFNGLEVIKIVRQQFPKIKIILFSAFDNDEDTQFNKIKEEYNLLDFIKKSTHGFPAIINTIRFNYSLMNLEKRKKRLKLALIALGGLFIIMLAQVLYFYSH